MPWTEQEKFSTEGLDFNRASIGYCKGEITMLRGRFCLLLGWTASMEYSFTASALSLRSR